VFEGQIYSPKFQRENKKLFGGSVLGV
jgi:hypothetical protein